MILVKLRQAIVTSLQEDVPLLADVKPHGGRFSLTEIKTAAARSPAARVACLGLRDISFAGALVQAESLWGVFFVTADQTIERRDALALSLVAAFAAVLPENCWGLETSIDGAKQPRADNLFSSDLEKNGIALWAVTFSHRVDLNRVSTEGLDDFLRAYVDYDLAPTDGTIDASDQINLPQE